MKRLTYRRDGTTFWLCVAACTVAATAWGFTINGNQDVGTGGQLLGTGAETNICAGGDGSTNNPYRYEWSGSPSTNLALGGSKIYTSNGKSFKLDLLRSGTDGTIIGAASNAITALSTAITGGSVSAGDVTVMNAVSVAIGKVDTRLINGLAYATGGNVKFGDTADRVGAVQIAGLVTSAGGWAQGTGGNHCGSVTVYAAGPVSIKDADGTRRDVDTSIAGRGNPGAITLDHQGNLFAGNLFSYASVPNNTYHGGSVTCTGDNTGGLDVSNICSYATFDQSLQFGVGGDVTINGYTQMTVNGAIDTSTDIAASGAQCGVAGGRSGHIVIGEVGARVGPVRVAGIDTRGGTWAATPGNNAGNVTIYGSGNVLIQDSGGTRKSILASVPQGRGVGGSITVDHNGDFFADQIDSGVYAAYADSPRDGGAVSCSGGNGGRFEASRIATESDASGSSPWVGLDAGSVNIRGYMSATVSGDIDTRGYRNAGAISITNITGDIAVRGTIDATGVTGTNGILTLTTTGPGSRITLASLDCSRVKARFQAAGGVSYVTGAVDNFDTTNSTTQTALDAGVGQRILYKYKASVLNDYLGGWTYGLPSGGVLKKEPAGTVVKLY